MINFSQLKGYKEFEALCLSHLLAASEQFFGCSALYSSAPLNRLQQDYGIDVNKSPRRGVYILDSTSVIILGRVLEGREVKAILSLKLTGAQFSGLETILNTFEAALAVSLSHSHIFKFQDRSDQFGDRLIELTISKYFSKGYYDHRRFLFLIETFRKLSTTTFEGRNFTTGLILTRSHYAYAEKGENTREGTLFELEKEVELSPKRGIDKRFWYLADGQTSFFLCNRQLQIQNLFVRSGGTNGLKSFVDDYSLSKTVKGGDALFRVTSKSEFSVTASGGIEFNYKENRWRVRNLKQIAELVEKCLGVKEDFVHGFLFYVFFLSRRRLSAIIWIPKDIGKIGELLLSLNHLTKKRFSILDQQHTQTLIRQLSSDGASIIDLNGEVVSFGSIIDISKVKIKGVKGTGESVSTLLAQNGLSVKISQDGNIKLFPGAESPPLII